MSGISAIRGGQRILLLSFFLLGIALIGQGSFTIAKAQLAQHLLHEAWAKTVNGEVQARPWPWADTWPVAKIHAPRLEKSNIVLAEAGGEALAFGPALLNASAKVGQPGQALIAAHRNTHFAWLGDLQKGDTLHMHHGTGAKIEYQVTGMQIVRFDASGIDPKSTKNQLGLITCYPLNAKIAGPLRYVVWAEPVA